MEDIDPRVHISSEVQSTDVVMLSLLELRWIVIPPDALPCSPEAHDSTPASI